MGLLDDSAYVMGSKTVTVKSGGKDIDFTVSAPGYVDLKSAIERAAREGKNVAGLLVVECVRGPKGEAFTYDEVRKFKGDIAEKFFEAIYSLMEVDPEKN